jgi:hypothetical protein
MRKTNDKQQSTKTQDCKNSGTKNCGRTTKNCK